MSVANFAWLSFAPSQLGLYLGPGSGRTRSPVSAAEALRASGALAVAPGPMFSGSDTVIYGLRDMAAGIALPSQYPTRGLSLCVVGGVARAVLGGAPLTGSTVAVQGYPSLLQSGVNVQTAEQDAGVDWRAALAVRDDGRMALCVGRAGMHDFAAELLSRGCRQAAYLDGGTSTALWQSSGDRDGSSAPRALPAWVLVRPPGGASGPWGPLLVTTAVSFLASQALKRAAR